MVKCPKEVRRAVKALASAVKMVSDLAVLPQPDPLTEYHAKEYLEEMETLLAYYGREEKADVLQKWYDDKRNTTIQPNIFGYAEYY